VFSHSWHSSEKLPTREKGGEHIYLFSYLLAGGKPHQFVGKARVEAPSSQYGTSTRTIPISIYGIVFSRIVIHDERLILGEILLDITKE